MSANTYQDGKEPTVFELKRGGKLPKPGTAASVEERGFKKVPTKKGKAPEGHGKKEENIFSKTSLPGKTNLPQKTSLFPKK